jgi:hypothetical protein
MKSNVVKLKIEMLAFSFGYSIENGHEQRTGTDFEMRNPRERNRELRNLIPDSRLTNSPKIFKSGVSKGQVKRRDYFVL